MHSVVQWRRCPGTVTCQHSITHARAKTNFKPKLPLIKTAPLLALYIATAQGQDCEESPSAFCLSLRSLLLVTLLSPFLVVARLATTSCNRAPRNPITLMAEIVLE